MIKVANVSEFRKNLKSYIDGVANNKETLIVNSNGKSVVVLSLDDYNAMDETDYLLSSEANKKMMYKAKEEVESGNLNEVRLNELIQKTTHD